MLLQFVAVRAAVRNSPVALNALLPPAHQVLRFHMHLTLLSCARNIRGLLSFDDDLRSVSVGFSCNLIPATRKATNPRLIDIEKRPPHEEAYVPR